MINFDTLRKAKGYVLAIVDESTGEYKLVSDDVIQVIRCKDCVYWKRYCRVVDDVTSHHVCGRKRELDGTMYRSKANDFCSWAERK